MIPDMGQTLHNVGVWGASGVAAASAVVAQVSRPVNGEVADGAMMLGFASVCAAVGPQVVTSLKLWFEDRKDQRGTKIVEITNKLSRANLRLIELEKIAAGTEALKDVARETQIRYEESQIRYEESQVRYDESQRRIAELEGMIDHLVTAVGENQDDIARVARNWKRPEPPPLAAVVNPAPIPPPPSSSRSSDNIPVPKPPPDDTPPHGTPVVKE